MKQEDVQAFRERQEARQMAREGIGEPGTKVEQLAWLDCALDDLHRSIEKLGAVTQELQERGATPVEKYLAESVAMLGKAVARMHAVMESLVYEDLT